MKKANKNDERPANGINMEDDASVGVSGESVQRLAKLVGQQVKMELVITELTNTLAEKIKDLNTLKQETIPTLMDEIGVKTIKLTTGESVEIKESVKASITEEKANKAFAWLIKNGHESLIKNMITVSFGMGEDKKAESLVGVLDKKDLPYSRKKSVNAQTLSAFVREQIEAGRKIPTDLFGVFIFRESKIKLPKKINGGD